MEDAFLVMQEARRETGRRPRRRREEETARAKALDRAATAVAAIGAAWKKFRRMGWEREKPRDGGEGFRTFRLSTAAVAHFSPPLKPNCSPIHDRAKCTTGSELAAGVIPVP